MATPQQQAAQVLFEKLAEVAKQVDELPNSAHRASALRNLAAAFRYISGGPQPGGPSEG